MALFKQNAALFFENCGFFELLLPFVTLKRWVFFTLQFDVNRIPFFKISSKFFIPNQISASRIIIFGQSTRCLSTMEQNLLWIFISFCPQFYMKSFKFAFFLRVEAVQSKEKFSLRNWMQLQKDFDHIVQSRRNLGTWGLQSLPIIMWPYSNWGGGRCCPLST